MQEQFEEVTLRKRGTIRENSLFHYVNDCLANPQLKPAHSVLNECLCQKGQGERSVFYISARERINSSELIVTGFDLVNCHLSIDKNYSLERSSASDYFMASHITMVLKKINTPEGLIIRVYFNQDAQLTTKPIRMVSCSLDANNHVTEQYELTQNIELNNNKVFTHSVFQKHKSLLDRLNKDKIEAYMDARSQSYQCLDQLEKEAKKQEWVKAKNTAQKVQALAEKITRYNDTIIDARSSYLDKMIGFYDQLINRPLAPIHSSIEKPLEVTMSTSSLELSTPNAVKDTNERLKTKIVALVTFINSVMQNRNKSLAEQLIERHSSLRELDECYLILSGVDSTPKQIQNYIKAQKNKVMFDEKSLYEHFDDFVRSGDAEQVKTLHETVSSYYDLKELYKNFLTDLYGVDLNEFKTSSQVDMAAKVQIARYFYDQSPLYRSMASVFQFIMLVSDRNLVYSCLMNCFLKDNSQGFQLLLEQGISLDSMHLMHGDIEFNALQALLLFYNHNPKPEYIQWALERGALTSFSIQTSYFKSVSQSQKTDKGSIGMVKEKSLSSIFSPLKGEKNLLGSLKSLIPIKTALQFIMKCYDVKYAELIHLVIPSTDTNELILALMHILNSYHFRTIFIERSNHLELHEIGLGSVIFATIDEVKAHLETAVREENNCYLPRTMYYSSHDINSTDALRQNVALIWHAIKRKFQNETVDNQQKLMLSMLMSQLKEAKEPHRDILGNTKDFYELMLYNCSIQLIYQWMSNHQDDKVNKWMIKSFDHISLSSQNTTFKKDEFFNNSIKKIEFSRGYFSAHLQRDELVQKELALQASVDNQNMTSAKNVDEENLGLKVGFFQSKPPCSEENQALSPLSNCSMI